MRFIAHSVNNKGNYHYLEDHLNNVALIMKGFVFSDVYKDAFYITGLLHDLGKYQPEFQRYLKERRQSGKVPHASLGAAIALQYKLYEAAFAIDGHHKGLPDKADLKDDCAEYLHSDNTILNHVKKSFFDEIKLTEEDLKADSVNLSDQERELFIRYLFSSLTDADWLDTEKHFKLEKFEKRNVTEFYADIFIRLFKKKIQFKSKEGQVTTLLNEASEEGN